MARDGSDDALRRCRIDGNGIVERERAVEERAGDLAAVRHLAESCGVECRWDLRRHRLDGRQDGYLRRRGPRA